MIQNFAAYNAWKRSTLDRLAAKYRRLFQNIFAAHLRGLENQMNDALERGEAIFEISADNLRPIMEKVLVDHQRAVVKSAVSDGMREMAPETKLATWQKWPVWYPVEDSFHNLAERKRRDDIFERLYGKMHKRYRSTFAKIIDLDLERYKRNVSSIFRKAADSYFKSPEENVTQDVVKDVIKRSLQVSDNSAERLFRTETTKYFNEARIGYFQTNTDVDFVQVVAITDGRISDICEHRNGFVLPISESNKPKYKPPYHWNCRTVLSPLDTDLKSDQAEVKANLGREFGTIKSETSGHSFTGKREFFENAASRKWA